MRWCEAVRVVAEQVGEKIPLDVFAPKRFACASPELVSAERGMLDAPSGFLIGQVLARASCATLQVHAFSSLVTQLDMVDSRCVFTFRSPGRVWKQIVRDEIATEQMHWK